MQVGSLERTRKATRHFFTIKIFKQIFSQTQWGTSCSKQFQFVEAKTEKKQTLQKIGYEKL